MKILLVASYKHLRSGSMNGFSSVLFRELTRLGHDVVVYSPKPLVGNLLPSPNGLGKWFGYIDRFVLGLPEIRAVAKRADLVHVCDHSNAVYYPVIKDKPSVLTCHDLIAVRSALGEFCRFHRTPLTGKLLQRFILRNLGRFGRIACVSETTFRDFVRFAPEAENKALVIHNGFYNSFFPVSRNEKESFLVRKGLKNKGFFLHVGNNNWYKNKKGLLRIFACLRGEVPYYRLVIAGRPLTDDLRAESRRLYIQDFIVEVPYPALEELRILYSSAKALIFPSIVEGFGLPVIEAQACGCPVFANRTSALEEVAGGSAVFFDAGDPCGSASIIVEVIRRKHELERITSLGYKNIRRFDTQRMVEAYRRLYLELV